MWSAYGGINSITIHPNGEYRVRPLPISQEFINEFHNSMVLFYTGQQRKSFEIAKSHDNIAAEKHKHNIHKIAEEALVAFANEDINEIGRLLDENWHQKKSTSPLISTSEIDDLYLETKKWGCLGFKLLGSGQSGFVLCITNDRKRLLNNISLQNIDFSFDFEGSKIILS